MAKRTARSRYTQLTVAQRAAASGHQNAAVMLGGGVTSFSGPPEELPLFSAQFNRLKSATEGWQSQEALLFGFTSLENKTKSTSKRIYRNHCSSLINGLIRFVEENKLQAQNIHEFNSSFFSRMRQWLLENPEDGSKKEYSGAYRANLQGRAFDLVEAVRASGRYTSSEEWALSRPAPISRRGDAGTEPLDDAVWRQLYLAAASEVIEIRKKCEEAWSVLDGEFVPPDSSRTIGKSLSDFRATLWAMKTTFPTGVIPFLRTCTKINRALSLAMSHIWGVEVATLSFQPSPRTMLPFVLLFMVYLNSNASPTKGLRTKHVKKIRGMKGLRAGFHLIKARGSNYTRTFALDPSDPLSPDELAAFVKRWTRRIRACAGVYKRYLFIFVTQDALVKPFSSSDMPGMMLDGCGPWNSALSAFREKWKLPSFGAKELRLTGLDAIRELFNEDPLAVKNAGGQSSSSVIDVHYVGGAARRRENEALGEIIATFPRFVATDGRIDPRVLLKGSDIRAATPGWNCASPYDSPMPGQNHGKLCSAFGQCPACPLTGIDITSPYACARSVQLRKKIYDSFETVEAKRWEAVYKPVLEKLENLWLPSFSAKVYEAATHLSLDEIGELD